MRRLLTTISAIALLGYLGRVDGQTDALSIAVSSLSGTGVSASEAAAITDALRTELGKTGVYDVLERGKMNEVLSEQGFQQSGACSDAGCAVEMGQLLAVKAMVLGSIGLVGQTYTLSIRLVDVATGRIEREVTEYHQGAVDALLTDVVPVAAGKLAGTYVARSRAGRVVGTALAIAAGVTVPVLIVALAKLRDRDGDDEHGAPPKQFDLTVEW